MNSLLVNHQLEIENMLFVLKALLPEVESSDTAEEPATKEL